MIDYGGWWQRVVMIVDLWLLLIMMIHDLCVNNLDVDNQWEIDFLTALKKTKNTILLNSFRILDRLVTCVVELVL